MEPHRYLQYSAQDHSEISRVLAVDILNYYFTHAPINSANRWKKKGNFVRTYKMNGNEEIKKSKPIGYEIVRAELLQHGYFDPLKFNLFPLESIWLDHSLRVGRMIPGNAPFIELGAEQVYGTIHPVVIKLEQNGVAATSMMNHLFRYVIFQRQRSIDESTDVMSIEWYLGLRNLVCDAVSLVEMTFNRLHYEAVNNPRPGWTVSPDLGPRHGGRIMDKLQWIFQCTGKHLPGIAEEKAALHRLKDLRNQLMHFDPPYFQMHFSDLPVYFNDIVLLGHLIYKIRKTIGTSISAELAAFLMQKHVALVETNEIKLGIQL